MSKPQIHMKIGSDPPMKTTEMVQEISQLVSEAIPDMVKRLDFLKSLRDEIGEREAEGAYAELDEWLEATLMELRKEFAKIQKENLQKRIYRFYAYLSPAAIPLLIGLLNGTIRIG